MYGGFVSFGKLVQKKDSVVRGYRRAYSRKIRCCWSLSSIALTLRQTTEAVVRRFCKALQQYVRIALGAAAVVQQVLFRLLCRNTDGAATRETGATRPTTS